MKTIIILIIVWIFVSQFIAWIIAGDNKDPDDVIGIWAGVFMFVPLAPLYILIWLLRKLLHIVAPMVIDEPTEDDVIP